MTGAQDAQGMVTMTRPPVVAVVSGKGGVGKTMLSVNLAIQLGRLGYRPLLVDLDPGLANADVHLRVAPRRTLREVLDGRAHAADCVLDGPAGMRFLPGGCGVAEMADLSRERAESLWRDVEGAFSGSGLVILDTGAGIGPGPLFAASKADLVVLVTTTEPPAVTDAYAVLKVLKLAGRGGHVTLVVNEVGQPADAVETATKLRTVATRFLGGESPELVGWLRRDALIEDGVRRQKPFALAPRAPIHDELAALASALLARLPGARRPAAVAEAAR